MKDHDHDIFENISFEVDDEGSDHGVKKYELVCFGVKIFNLVFFGVEKSVFLVSAENGAGVNKMTNITYAQIQLNKCDFQIFCLQLANKKLQIASVFFEVYPALCIF